MMFGYKEKPNFTVENEKEISTAPKVDFNPAPAAPSKCCITDQKIDRDERCKSRPACAAVGWVFPALAEVAVPPLTGRVVDQTGTLCSGDIASLTQTLKVSRPARAARSRC